MSQDIATEVARAEYVDVVTEAGCTAVGLPTTYSLGGTGRMASWAVCQPIGQRAWDAGERGIACRTVVPDGSEELAHSARPKAARVERRGRWPFDEWLWPATSRVEAD